MRRASDSANLGVMTKAVITAGLVSQEQLDEMKRWPGGPDAEAAAEPPRSLEEVVGLISEALQSEGYVLMRETDLEVVRQYAATAQRGVLHLEVPDDSTDIEVTYGKTPLGEYVIHWYSESIKDTLINGETFLLDGATRVFFKDVRELFFGEQKAFMVCIPSTVEHVE